MDQAGEVKQKTDIVSVIGEHVKLTRAGRHFKGLCPFHQEKSPSFMVSPELQIYKCFGCGKAGDVYTFLQEYEGMDFYEALKHLADKAGVKLVARQGGDSSLKAQILEANKLAASFYNYLLTKHCLGSPGKEYLVAKRGIKDETIATFNLGFAPTSPSLLFDTLTKKKKIDAEVMVQAGLCFKTRNGHMDRFRGRAIFPISNHRGEVVALAGRVLPEYDDGKSGKYINSPETPVYHKSSSLYGLNITKQEIRKRGTAVVVEGELDLLSLWQVGATNVVAIKGTALTKEHALILSRFAESLILALDSDFAGDNAVLRGMSFAQNAGLSVKAMRMGEHKDPDEFARADAAGALAAIKNSVDAWEYAIDFLAKRHDVSTGEGKARASRQIVPILADIDDEIVRSHYLQKVAQKLQVPFESVARQTEKYAPTKAAEAETPNLPAKQKSRRELLEEKLLELVVSFKPDLIEDEQVAGLVTSSIGKRFLSFAREHKKSTKSIDSSALSNALPEEMKVWFASLVLASSEENEESAEQEINTVIRELKNLTVREELDSLAQKIKELEVQGKRKGLSALQKEFRSLSRKLVEAELE